MLSVEVMSVAVRHPCSRSVSDYYLSPGSDQYRIQLLPTIRQPYLSALVSCLCRSSRNPSALMSVVLFDAHISYVV